MPIGYRSETGRLIKVAVKHARDAFISGAKIDAEWRPLNYDGRPELSAAIAKSEGMARMPCGARKTPVASPGRR